MKIIFIGGSRKISRLPSEVEERVDNIVSGGHHVLVGDANGVDRAVQAHLFNRGCQNVTVFISDDQPRNNVGGWRTHKVAARKPPKDYHFYAAKDLEMAHRADFGLMVWDGKSPGTLLNVVRLIEREKVVVLFHVPCKETLNFKAPLQLGLFLKGVDPSILASLEKRASSSERRFISGELAQSSH